MIFKFSDFLMSIVRIIHVVTCVMLSCLFQKNYFFDEKNQHICLHFL